MEAGNRGEEEGHQYHSAATLATHDFASQSSEHAGFYQQHHHHHSILLDSSDDQSSPVHTLGQYRPFSPSTYASYAARNFHAADVNATRHEPLGVGVSDSSYRAYDPGISHNEAMASNLRSKGNASTSRQHPGTSSVRTGLRPAVRSVSAPVDDKLPPTRSKHAAVAAAPFGVRSGHQPSVKDLKKRFDQHSVHSNNSPHGKVAPRIPAREISSPADFRGVGSSSVGADGQTSYAVLRSPATRDAPSRAGTVSTPRSMQRNKTVQEDQMSNNSQSFASRIAKPRPVIGTQNPASKSITNLSPTTSPSSIPPLPQSRGLLFGEIIPDEVDAGIAGYGIKGAQTGRRQRSLSHTDAEPPSPSDWYRGANGDSIPRGDSNQVMARSVGGHGRSQSDLAGTKPIRTKSKSSKAARPRPTLDTSMLSSSSKIPISVRKLSSPSTSSSPASTRSSSPSTRKRPSAPPKTSKPTRTTRAKTPTNGPNTTTRRPNRVGAVTPNDNTRLNVFVSTPPPKLSPPLRSSRPRQPVSSATTASSRMRAVDRGISAPKPGNKSVTDSNEPTPRRRKISVGPIDFESRREQIKLSYSRSIRESQVRTTTKKLAEETRKKAETDAGVEPVNVGLDAAEAPQETLFHDSARSPIDAEISPAESLAMRTITAGLLIESPADAETPASEKVPLRSIETGLALSMHPRTILEEDSVSETSPPLGIPGSFPTLETPDDLDEGPPSAISATTEFDVEPQTKPPLQQISAQKTLSASYDADEFSRSTNAKSEYRSPFEDELPIDEGTFEARVDDSKDTRVLSMEPQLSVEESSESHEPSGAHRVNEDEYEPKPLKVQSYQTKVTILGRDSDFSPSQMSMDGQASPCDLTSESSNRVPQSPSHDLPVHSVGLSDIEEFFIGPVIKESRAVHQDIEAQPEQSGSIRMTSHSSTDARYSTDSRRTLGTRPSLTVPRTSESLNRASQTTVWTDYSVNSEDRYSDYGFKYQDPTQGNSGYREDQVASESEPSSKPYLQGQESGNVSHSRDISPHGTCRASETHNQQHRLPELDTGGGFVVDYLGRKDTTTVLFVPSFPDHSPPPPPDEVSVRDIASSRAASEYFDDTRPSSYLHTGKDDRSLHSLDPMRRRSEDFGRSESISHSIDQHSIDTSEGAQSGSSRLASQQTLADSIDQTTETQGLSEKERKRLFTRLETIKELIDTEAFFIRDMNIVEEIYKGTAEACPKLDDKTIKLIFRNTDQIIKFHSSFLAELKEGASSIYTPRGHRSNLQKDVSSLNDGTSIRTASTTPATGHLSDDKDRETSIGPIFTRNMDRMKVVHETFLKNSDHAAKRLIQIQEDPTVQVWLNECNEVARDLTKAWNLDSLLIKPMQRITKYPNLLIQLLHETPSDHPDRPLLESAKLTLEVAIEEINKTKKNFELVGQIVGRKRKESDVKAGFARAFGKRVDKLQASTNRPPEDPEFLKLHERFGDDYLRLQVVLRDVEFYTRQVSEYVHEFLQYLSSVELVMRFQPSPYPMIESKWVRFNISMRDIEKIALEQHLSQVRKQVIEPFELVIKSYGNPSLAMKKRSKRRLDYERSVQLKKGNKKVDKQLYELGEQYEALNEALKKELPKLSALTEKVGNICLGNFVNIQAQWFKIWKEKLKIILDNAEIPEVPDIISTFQRDYKFQDEQINMIGIVNPASFSRPSQSTSVDESIGRLRPRPSELSPRNRGLSLNSDMAPSLPTPDFLKRHSGQFTVSPSIASIASVPSPHQYYYRDYYSGINIQGRPSPGSPNILEASVGSHSLATPPVRPGTGQSYDSNGVPRQPAEPGVQSSRYSHSAYPSPHQNADSQRFSGVFQSALPLSETQERQHRPSHASSRGSSRERQPINGYNVLWLAASLFEFNIETTKHEAGYPYLTYQAGEIFDVIGEKGELWLAKNQDDPNNMVGWLWSKHFAKLADD